MKLCPSTTFPTFGNKLPYTATLSVPLRPPFSSNIMTMNYIYKVTILYHDLTLMLSIFGQCGHSEGFRCPNITQIHSDKYSLSVQIMTLSLSVIDSEIAVSSDVYLFFYMKFWRLQSNCCMFHC